ncbi:MAG TPA: PIG-L deacetylase family protein [Acidimicrobiales bacterium]|nr:PIG-L deacetylase family protein [Acidimicrobiales bacterium]
MDLSPERVLAVYAHPDDAEVSCGGALALFAERGADVLVAVVARGDKGSSTRVSDVESLVAARHAETEAAGVVLGVTAHRWLDRDDGEVVNDALLRADLVAMVRELRPDLVVTPDPTAVYYGATYVNHPDHRAVGWATLDAVTHAAPNPNYHPGAEPWRSPMMLLSGSLEPDAWIDIAATIDAKAAALACHTSQLGEAGEYLRTVVRQRAEDEGRVAGVKLAEGFRLLRLG